MSVYVQKDMVFASTLINKGNRECVLLCIVRKGNIDLLACEKERDIKRMLGGMQNEKESKKYSREIKVLMQLFKENVKEEELIKHLEEMNGNVSLVIEKMVLMSMTNQVNDY
ncbi:hypothetical protein RFI_32117 [Reticulomyxa filosa]|uniref:Uncharacterized protein n=1 Tax=Reticulomyxa filosa TaxID=46433 RepID=X6LTM6_RETFI|nr:hypothetical protein RFI_32117 [Reticulomyxa filosa]|eukprot:ETO05278.1 hypothetical protein RFI_32117 [Reticulomyxa filosa]